MPTRQSLRAGRLLTVTKRLAIPFLLLGITCSFGAQPAGAVPAASPAPSGLGPCAVKPSATTTGASGRRANSSVTTLGNGQVLQNANVSELVISGRGVTVRNVQVNGSILVIGDGATIDHVTAKGVSISSASGTTVQYTNIGFGRGDGIHVTSDRGRLVRNVTLRYNYVHDPRVSSTAHYDGTQVRGINGLSLSCSVYDPGAYQHMYNAAVYLEDANGGDSNIVVSHNWLYGFGFSVMMDAANVTLSTNRVGGDIHWGLCRLGTRSGDPNLTSLGNVWDASGSPVKLCR